MKRIILYSFIIFIIYGCKDNTPKPIGYNRIERVNNSYKLFENPSFSFIFSDLAYIDTMQIEKKDNKWFNIVYPQFNAQIYCSYTPITKKTLTETIQDSYRLAYSHSIKADGISQTLYNNAEHKTSGILYDIEGNVATPIQFFLTDSTSNFFRASLYYDVPVNNDSIFPVTQFIREDIIKLIDSFEWN